MNQEQLIKRLQELQLRKHQLMAEIKKLQAEYGTILGQEIEVQHWIAKSKENG